MTRQTTYTCAEFRKLIYNQSLDRSSNFTQWTCPLSSDPPPKRAASSRLSFLLIFHLLLPYLHGVFYFIFYRFSLLLMVIAIINELLVDICGFAVYLFIWGNLFFLCRKGNITSKTSRLEFFF